MSSPAPSSVTTRGVNVGAGSIPSASSALATRRKSNTPLHVRKATATQTLPRGFVLPQATREEEGEADEPASAGDSALRSSGSASPLSNSLAAPVHAAQVTSSNSNGPPSSPLPRTPTPSTPHGSAGGHRRSLSSSKLGNGTSAAAASSASPEPVSPASASSFASDGSGANVTPRVRKSTGSIGGTEAGVLPLGYSTPKPRLSITGAPLSGAAGGMSGAKARMAAASARGQTIGRASLGSMPRSIDADILSPSSSTGAVPAARPRSSSNASGPSSSLAVTTLPSSASTGRLSLSARPVTTASHHSRQSFSGALSFSFAAGGADGSGGGQSVPLTPGSAYSPSDFASAKSLSASGGERENIMVAVRCRPFIKEEAARGADTSSKRVVKLAPDSVQCEWKEDKKTFTFDHVFHEASTQQDVYRETAGSLVHQALQGFNATIFAYGQTGSVSGVLDEGHEQNGIIPRAVDHIFKAAASSAAAGTAASSPPPSVSEEEADDAAMAEAAVSSMLGQPQYLLSLSFLEIYNERVHDLLAFTGQKVALDVREDTATGGFHVPNLSRHIVTTRSELLKLLVRGNENRSVTSTIMNEGSSRSHSMLTIYMEKAYGLGGAKGDDGDTPESTMITQSKLNLVDLAGSERLTTAAGDTTGLETRAINLSLTSLANVISALTSPGPQHVPYRDSKLTRLLKDALGGNAKTLMLACLSPSMSCLAETVSTLRYASRAKKIQNKARINEDPKDALLKALQSELVTLKEALADTSKLPLRMYFLVHDLHVGDGLPVAAAVTVSGADTSNAGQQKLLTSSEEPAVASSDDDSAAPFPNAVATASPSIVDAAASSTAAVSMSSPVELHQQLLTLEQLRERLSSAANSAEAESGTAEANHALLSVRSLARFKDEQDSGSDTRMVLSPGAGAEGALQQSDPSSWSGSVLYAEYRRAVLRLYMALLLAQQQLAQRRQRLELLEGVVDDVRQIESAEGRSDKVDNAPAPIANTTSDGSATSTSLVRAASDPPQASPAAAAASISGEGDTASPFSPISPTAVLNEATRRMRENNSSSAAHSRRNSSATTASSAAATESNSAGDASATDAAAVSSDACRSAKHSRRPSIDELLLSRTTRLSAVLGSPQDGAALSADGLVTPGSLLGGNTASPAAGSGDQELSIATQHQLQQQAALEALRTQLAEKDEALLAAHDRAAQAEQLAVQHAAAALAQAQDRALEAERRLEGAETQLEKQRMQEANLTDILREHHEGLASTFSQQQPGSLPLQSEGLSSSPIVAASGLPLLLSPAGSPGSLGAASPASYNLTALISPGYLHLEPLVAAASATSAAASPPTSSSPLVLGSPPNVSSTSSSADATVAAPTAAILAPDLSSHESRMSYLRSALSDARATASAIPQFARLLQDGVDKLTDMERRTVVAEKQMEIEGALRAEAEAKLRQVQEDHVTRLSGDVDRDAAHKQQLEEQLRTRDACHAARLAELDAERRHVEAEWEEQKRAHLAAKIAEQEELHRAHVEDQLALARRQSAAQLAAQESLARSASEAVREEQEQAKAEAAAQIAGQKAAHETELAALRDEHARQLAAQLAEREKTLVAEASRRQVELEEQLAQQGRQHVAALAALEAGKDGSAREQIDAQIAVRDQQHAAALNAAEFKHREALEEMRRQQEAAAHQAQQKAEEKQHAQQQQHDANLAALRKELEQQLSAQSESLAAAHANSERMLREQMETQQTQHDDQHAATLASLETTHASALADVQEQLKQQQQKLSASETAAQQFAKQLQQQQEQHAAALIELKEAHARALADALAAAESRQQEQLASQRDELLRAAEANRAAAEQAAAAAAALAASSSASTSSATSEAAAASSTPASSSSAGSNSGPSAPAASLDFSDADLAEAWRREREMLQQQLSMLQAQCGAPGPDDVAVSLALSSPALSATPRKAAWLESSLHLQNSVIALSNKISEMGNNKREQMRNAAIELHRMRNEMLQAGHDAHAPSAGRHARTPSKPQDCVVQ